MQFSVLMQWISWRCVTNSRRCLKLLIVSHPVDVPSIATNACVSFCLSVSTSQKPDVQTLPSSRCAVCGCIRCHTWFVSFQWTWLLNVSFSSCDQKCRMPTVKWQALGHPTHFKPISTKWLIRWSPKAWLVFFWTDKGEDLSGNQLIYVHVENGRSITSTSSRCVNEWMNIFNGKSTG